ncbi:WecB/TagA/CpsF family glycosyltransferase [Mucilaginibacter daejeonensis]|uniref:WecB/TagA/CpsF family glycosyltransferase n=1 Tax=Mucilaginibacter daejeonensis TaxID=398049 RepID=UPI001D176AE4|nr:WecB/TagA/CpsF family glycosyltransferase [Mucilaginibacter daejeonensis]UEG54951.1 WecB/TagA/CpsF family glycosyltransferase [Mucilaginibacter daejeonensis]
MLKLESKFNISELIGHDVTFANPYSWQLLSEADPKAIAQFKIFVDGILLVKVNNFFTGDKIDRYSFDDTSIAPIVFKYACDHKQSIYLAGGVPGVTKSAKEYISMNNPSINIIGNCAGYFASNEERGKSLNEALKSDIVIVGMGTPYQEYFLTDLRNKGWKGTGFTCGGYMDQLVESKGGNYYPDLVNKWNVRALYRLFREPGRLWKRYLIMYPLFLYSYLKSKRNKG